jgi:hypothetical protein
MARTWWVNVIFGGLFAWVLVLNIKDERWDRGHFAMVPVQVGLAGLFFFEGGRLWEQRRQSMQEVSSEAT